MVKVGLLDAGYSPQHQAFQGQHIHTVSIDASGRVLENAFCDDPHGHGTHIAGILCGVGKEHDFSAPDIHLHIAAATTGGDELIRIVAGIDWLIQQGVRILCLPIGIPARNLILYPLLAAARRAGILPIAAIGNCGAGRHLAPGCHDVVLAVGGHDRAGLPIRDSGTLWDAHHGRCVKPDLLAPGHEIVSVDIHGGFCVKTGTSQACAIVARHAARLWSHFPEATAAHVEAALIQGAAHPRDDLRHTSAFGNVSLDSALKCLEKMLGENHRPLSMYQPPLRSIDPVFVQQCVMEHGKTLKAVIAAQANSHSTDPRGTAGALVDAATLKSGTPPRAVSYIPHANMGCVEAESDWFSALLKLEECWMVSASSVG